MAIVDLVMPKLGESIMEATILKWVKNIGDTIAQDETVLEIATDKVDSEVPSSHAGILTEILYKVDDIVPIGSVIARIETNISAAANNTQASTPVVVEIPATIVQEEKIQIKVQPELNEIPYQPSLSVNISSARFYSPLVMNIAQQEGINMQELETIVGTGQDGRVSKKDIIQFVNNRSQAPQTAQVKANITPTTEPTLPQVTPAVTTTSNLISTSHSDNQVEIIEMDRMRKLIAKHMIDSKQTSAHVTSFAEADVTNMVVWREKVKAQFEKQEGEKITFTPLFIDALVRCLKKFPMLNSSLDGDKIIIKKNINIGMAAALPTGNLIVPVIKNADQLNLVGLTKQVNGLAFAARNNKLKPDETQGGTFTLTNVGSFGSLMGTPIINQPQVAILAVGAIKKRAVVIESKDGDSIGIRQMMFVSLSYDHRIIDGALGGSFLNAFAKELEAFDINKII